MRYFIFMLWICLPCTAGATAAPIGLGETAITHQSIPHGFAQKKQRFGERITRKILAKRLKKNSAQPYGADGKGLCIAGFVIGILLILACIPPFFIAIVFNIGFIPYLILGLTGLVLSILGWRKAEGWEQTRGIRRLAIAGIIINGLFSLLGLLILLL
jgi:hypothetical protein